MGILYSYVLGYGRTDDPNPITGLTSRDIYLIRSTWKIARSDPIKLGVDLLVEYNMHNIENKAYCKVLFFFTDF